MKFLLIFFVILVISIGYSETHSIIGKVFDLETNKPISGARINIVNSNRGTYTTSSGFFRLININLNDTITVSSIGYEIKPIEISKIANDTIIIFLKPKPLIFPAVEKVSDIEVDEIIRRAIKKKKENLSRIQTLQARIYSKLFIEFGGPSIELKKGKQSGLNVSINPIKTKDSLSIEFIRYFIFETFSNLFADFSKKFKIIEITERRQTANFLPEANLIAFTEFYNFYDEKLNILNTIFITPLAENAFDYYKFKLLGKQLYGNYYVYDIQIEPITKIFPTFVGRIKIIEGTYNLLEIDLRPSMFSEVPMLDSISFVQKFSQVDEKLWQPTFFEFTAKANLTIIKNLLDLTMKFRATSIVSDAIINLPLPDTIYKKNYYNKALVSPKADSTTPEFWEKNSPVGTQLSELEIYRRIDTISKKIDFHNKLKSINNEYTKFDFGFEPFSVSGEYNRVTGYAISFEPFIKYDAFELTVIPYYSFGLKKTFGSINIKQKFNRIQTKITIFSKVDYTSIERECNPSLSSLIAYFLHWDYYDYFRKDGFQFDAKFNLESLAISIGFEKSKHFSLGKTTNRSLFSNSIWRKNPEIDEGLFQTLFFELDYGNFFASSNNKVANYFINVEKIPSISCRTRIFIGTNEITRIPFGLFDLSFNFYIPVIFTGYTPISMNFRLDYGNATHYLPLQYHFRLPIGILISAPFGIYGGTEYLVGLVTLNLSDIWWRVLKLPKFDGKGLDLKLIFGAGKTYNNSREYIYESTKKQFYTEFGIGFDRIPTLISNLVYLYFETRWGFGALGKGNWRFNLGLSLPF